jgi:hypothetical protein
MIELQGRLVPLATAEPQRAFVGRVRIGTDGLIEAVRSRRASGAAAASVIDVGDAFIYPGAHRPALPHRLRLPPAVGRADSSAALPTP